MNIPTKDDIYFLGYSKGLNCFLYKDKVIISAHNCEKEKNNNFIVDSMTISGLYVITLLKEYPHTSEDIIFETIKQGDYTYNVEDFLNWIDMPSSINIDIDLPYYKIIKFLQKFDKTTFQTKNFLFYSQKDDDFCYTLNFYARDLKNNAELKLYIPDKFIHNDCGEWINIPPENIRNILAVDLSGKLSKYQIRQCKKDFLKFANGYCEELKTKNFYALELVKQTILPVLYDRGWAICRIFAGDDKFTNIWVSDFMLNDEEPYFIITDNSFSWCATKAATINIKNPKYHKKGIYKQGLTKFKGWKLDEQYIKELMEYFKSPINEKVYTSSQDVYKKYIKTKWQQLIYYYNYNTAGCNIDENGCIIPEYGEPVAEPLQLDLPIPDYTKLLQDEDEE